MRAKCSVEDCPATAHSRGMCPKHATRFRRYGNTDDRPLFIPSLNTGIRGLRGCGNCDRLECWRCRNSRNRKLAREREQRAAESRRQAAAIIAPRVSAPAALPAAVPKPRKRVRLTLTHNDIWGQRGSVFGNAD